jgi:hypothetical protein
MSPRIASRAWLFLLLLPGCPAAPIDPGSDGGATDTGLAIDASRDDGGAVDGGHCASSAACDDGLFCNGTESCAGGACVAGTAPCPVAACHEERDACDCPSSDADSDGSLSIACGGTDCDDTNPNRFPGHTEVCDVAGTDEDCDATTFGFRDADGDGSADASCCNHEGGTDVCGFDCNDAVPGVHPSATEACNGIDDDCDTAIDEGVTVSCWTDGDSDGYAGASAVMTTTCTCPARTTNLDPATSADCDDAVAFSYPGAAERCDVTDNDCDTLVDEGVTTHYTTDADGDGFGTTDLAAMVRDACGPPTGFGLPTDCDDADATIRPTAPERCDAGLVDEDCDGMANPPTLCGCVTGEMRACATLAGVCAAGNEECIDGVWGACSVLPSTEVCNGSDDDCDGTTDEHVDVACFGDGDRDGFAPVSATVTRACGGCPVGRTSLDPAVSADCDDALAQVHPGAPELCDRHDDDCNGGDPSFEDADGDGHTRLAGGSCTGGFPIDDCDDRDARVFPGQTLSFVVGYCPPSGNPCMGGSCCDVSDPSLFWRANQFDFDCDGELTPDAPAACTSSCFPTGDCGHNGPVADADPSQCGQVVGYTDCGSGECGACARTSLPFARLACR